MRPPKIIKIKSIHSIMPRHSKTWLWKDKILTAKDQLAPKEVSSVPDFQPVLRMCSLTNRSRTMGHQRRLKRSVRCSEDSRRAKSTYLPKVVTRGIPLQTDTPRVLPSLCLSAKPSRPPISRAPLSWVRPKIRCKAQPTVDVSRLRANLSHQPQPSSLWLFQTRTSSPFRQSPKLLDLSPRPGMLSVAPRMPRLRPLLATKKSKCNIKRTL